MECVAQSLFRPICVKGLCVRGKRSNDCLVVKARFLADADLNSAIVRGAVRREPRLDFQTAQAAGLRGMKDPEVLAVDVPGEALV
jgi:hypothetical protein